MTKKRLKGYPSEVILLAKRISAVAFDVDGVFTNNTELLGLPDGCVAKYRSYYDGQGVSLLRAIGIRVALITNEKDKSAVAITKVVEKWNNLKSSKKKGNKNGWHPVGLFTGMGGSGKIVALNTWLSEIGLTNDQCAAMGDDLVDVPFLKQVALRAAPISGEMVIKDMAHFISERPGGSGAVRDFVNFIIQCRDIDPTSLPEQ